MGCFLSCFRGGSSPSGDLRDPLVGESRLGDAFLNDEKKFDGATVKLDGEPGNGHGVDEELRREANYLKSCGTISQTPPEILDSIPINSEDTNECGDTPTNMQQMKDVVLVEENSSERLNSDDHDVSRHKHDTDEGTFRMGSETKPSLEDKPSCQNVRDQSTDSSDSLSDFLGGLQCGDTPSNVQEMRDVVLVEENSSELLNSDDDHDVSRHKQDTDEGTLTTGSETQPSLEDKTSCHQNVRDQSADSSDSPYPTPLVLRGDIQTPGTVYAAVHKETSKPGKRTRAFIYPVLRPIENKMQWMELKAESPTVLSSNPPKRRNLSAGSGDKAQQPLARSAATDTGSSDHGSFPNIDNCAAQNEAMSPDKPRWDEVDEPSKQGSEYGKRGVVTSLSHWLKPSSADDESNGCPNDSSNVETRHETDVSDMPIFPAFGLDWETDNPTPMLPKAWDGNGIPNTTTKYKEDQKVSWHATPFEERLLKVLSDEKPRHERRISGKLIHLEENAE